MNNTKIPVSPFDDGKYRLLVENITDYAIYMLDVEGRIVSWNAGAQRFKGYAADEIIGQHFSRFHTEEDRQDGLPTRALAAAVKEGRFEQEGWRVRKDGTRFWASVIIDPIFDEGQHVGFAKITRDLTERRAAEEALRASQEQFRVLVQGVTDYAIYMLDPNGIVSNWNLGAQRIKGYAPSEIVGRHFSTFYTQEDREAGEPQRALEMALARGQYGREGWRVRKDGTRFWANVLIDPIRSPEGELIGFAKVTRDITDRRAKEIELAKTQEALRQSQKMEAVGQLTGGVAHDFNNLLTIIMSSVDFLRKPNLSDERRANYVNAISDTVERASKLTSQLLSFARRQTLKPEAFNVRDQVASVVDLIQPLVGGLISIELNHASAECIAVADISQFETALVNLAVNARDAMNGEGSIRIDIGLADVIPPLRTHPTRKGRFVAVSVGDTGVGIPPERLEQIFEPFFTTKPVGQGTGLGLSQVFGFAKQTGGDIMVESAVGVGTTFTLFLPQSEQIAVQVEEEDDPNEEAAHADARILVVEDNRRVGEFTRDMLQDLGFRPMLVPNAKEALKALANPALDFELVFSDVIMPEMNGVDLAHLIKDQYPHLPIILASGYSEVLAQAGVQNFDLVRKPYAIDALSRSISQALRRARREPRLAE